jgi:chromosome segregation ATPase
VNKKIELEKLDRAIKDGEIRLRTVKTNIEVLTREIDTLSQLEGELIDNIKFLKQNKVVAMAGEFKKVKEDLAKTTIRIIALRNDREHFRKSANDVDELIKKAKKDIEKLNNKNDNILYGKFKRK